MRSPLIKKAGSAPAGWGIRVCVGLGGCVCVGQGVVKI